MVGEARRAAWREPMAWLVAGLPLAVVVAALLTIHVARRSPADASSGGTRRIAQMQLEDLAPDREAARRGLLARLESEPAQGRLALEFASGSGPEVELELSMLHPVDASLDRRLVLQRSGDTWRATTTPWRTHAWSLRLRPSRGDWRLSGRLDGDATHATLSPAVEP